MGVVWEAVHTVTRKPVALKFLKRQSDDAAAVRRFLREARAACAVRHPNVVEVHDLLELADGSHVMVMDLLSGETLAERLERQRPMTLPEVAGIMVHVCSAVSYAHGLGIVHRDLKPENIFLAKTPVGRAVKVLDFGIAKLTASEGDAARTGAMTGSGNVLGTLFYMAPEQLFGASDVDHRADLWALGVILLEALTSATPAEIYKLASSSEMARLQERASGLPGPVVDLVIRMLSVDRDRRPADVQETLSLLASHTSERFVVAEKRGSTPRLADSVSAAPAAMSHPAFARTEMAGVAESGRASSDSKDTPGPVQRTPRPAGHDPVRTLESPPSPIRPVRKRASREDMLRAGTAVAIAVSLFFAFGGRTHGAGRPIWFVLGTLAGWTCVAAWAIRAALMGGRHGGTRRFLVSVALSTPAVLFAFMLVWNLVYPESLTAFSNRIGFRCLGLTLAMGIWPLFVLALALRDSEPEHPRATGAALGSAAGAGAGILTDLWCPASYPSHIAIGHILPVLILCALGAVLGKRLLSARVRSA